MRIRQNVLRGKLLLLLKDVYPDGIEQKTVVGIFYQYHKVDDIVCALQYLTDKNYCEKKSFPHPYKEGEQINSYKILPAGIDLAEGLGAADPGVVIAPEV